jgi:hypothetical protein
MQIATPDEAMRADPPDTAKLALETALSSARRGAIAAAGRRSAAPDPEPPTDQAMGIAPGEEIVNPALHLRAVVLESSPQILRAEAQAGSGGNGGPLHRHLRQEERFVVREGTAQHRRSAGPVGAVEAIAGAAGHQPGGVELEVSAGTKQLADLDDPGWSETPTRRAQELVLSEHPIRVGGERP